jgi:hypothetical protein
LARHHLQRQARISLAAVVQARAEEEAVPATWCRRRSRTCPTARPKYGVRTFWPRCSAS